MKNLVLIFLFLFSLQIQSQEIKVVVNPLVKEANSKIAQLEKLLEKAKKKKIDVTKEVNSVYVATIFLKYAQWDEEHVAVNTKLFKQLRIFKKNASDIAQKLPRLERKEVIKILDNATKEINELLSKKKKRQKSNKVDWRLAKVEGDRITINGKTAFLTDFISKPEEVNLDIFFGNKDSYYIDASQLEKDALVNQTVIDLLTIRKEIALGTTYLDPTKAPLWVNKIDNGNINKLNNIFTSFDIDHPDVRKIYQEVLTEIIPYTTGKSFADLGYMLANKPYLTELDDGKILDSKYTKEKFKSFLVKKHQTIKKLDKAWNTYFYDFADLDNLNLKELNVKGSPFYYDWTTFKMDRVTDWFNFLKFRIQKDNPKGKVFLGLTPKVWLDGNRAHGADLEALVELSGVMGTSTGADHIRIFGKPLKWEKRYKYDWVETCMSYDFMKSVSPNKPIYDAECHFLSNKKSKDLYLDPLFARSIFWLAHIHGLSASNIWYWPRGIDGEIDPNLNPSDYAGTNSQQALVTNEFINTMVDINANAEDILSFQRAKKPIRIFYSKTSAINKTNYMESIYSLYEQVKFNGVPVGFVTQKIIEQQDSKDWDVVLIKDTTYITNEELKALQAYLNAGGIIVLDNNSLKFNEYGVAIDNALAPSKGRIIVVDNIEKYETKSLAVMSLRNRLPNIRVEEINENGKKGCIWNVTKNKKGENILSIVNVGNTVADLTITLNENNKTVCTSIIDGVETSNTPSLGPYEVYYVKVSTN